MSALGRSKRTGRVSRREFMKLGGAAAAVGLGRRAARAARTTKTDRPSLLLILTDQQHIDTISAAGCRHVRTPALDRLASRGVRFAQSHSANPLCSPARSAIFTGRTSAEAGVHVNGRPIRRGMPNVGQWLAERAGYECVYAGKWHLPRAHSFAIPGFRVLNTGIGGQGNLGDTCTSRACEAFLHRRRGADRPFLLVASFLQPHDICEWLRMNTRNPGRLRYPELADRLPELPANFRFDAAEPEVVKRKRRGGDPARGGWNEQQWRYYLWSYYRHVEMVDAEVGRVLRALEDAGRDRDTLVVFTADHGEGTAHHQMVRKNSPYEESVKVPLIASLPGRVPAGKADTTHLVSGLDVTPTLCDYAGVDPPPKMRGDSLRPVLEGRAGAPRRFVVTEVNANRGRMLRTPRHKYVAYAGDPVEQLFDMQADPGETKNLARDAACASVLAEHRKLLKQWEARLDLAPDVPRHDA